MASAAGKTVYVVYAAEADHATGSGLSLQIVAIQDSPEAAERLEAAYRDLEAESDHVARRVFTQRYTLPYAAPAVRDLIGKG